MKEKSWIDQHGRLFGKISIIDVLVIVAVLFLTGAVYMKNNVLETTATTTPDQEILLLVELKMVPLYAVEALAIGDTFYDKDHATGGAIGQVVDIEVIPGSTSAALIDGSLSLVTSESEVNVLVTLSCRGNYSNGRYVINRVYEIGANAYRNFETKYMARTGMVRTVSLGEG